MLVPNSAHLSHSNQGGMSVPCLAWCLTFHFITRVILGQEAVGHGPEPCLRGLPVAPWGLGRPGTRVSHQEVGLLCWTFVLLLLTLKIEPLQLVSRRREGQWQNLTDGGFRTHSWAYPSPNTSLYPPPPTLLPVTVWESKALETSFQPCALPPPPPAPLMRR